MKKVFCLFVLNEGTKAQEPPANNAPIACFHLTFLCGHPETKVLELSPFWGAHQHP